MSKQLTDDHGRKRNTTLEWELGAGEGIGRLSREEEKEKEEKFEQEKLMEERE